jgi:hypothetical protein
VTGFICCGADDVRLGIDWDDELDRKGGCKMGNGDVEDNKAVFRDVIGFDDGAICRAPSVRAPDDLLTS